MLTTLAIQNYRSLRDIRVPLERLNVITGANGSGKSNLYKALRLLAQTAQGGVVHALALEGGLDSSFWAGPENITKGMHRGETPIEPTVRQRPKRLKLGFASDEYSYLIELGLPIPSPSLFSQDPQIKREAIWVGNKYRPAAVLVERRGPLVKSRAEQNKQAGWQTLSQKCNSVIVFLVSLPILIAPQKSSNYVTVFALGDFTITFVVTVMPQLVNHN